MGKRLRMLGERDAVAAVALDMAAYGRAAPETGFAKELRDNPVARYIGLEDAEGRLIGMAGSWYQLDEAHVVTVAVHPEVRGRGYGRLLLHALVDLAIQYEMNVATLEVRPSNEAARGLYRVYGFHEVGRRKAYYPDTGEDAVIMTTEELHEGSYQRRFALLASELAERVPGVSPTLRGAALPPDLQGE